MKLMRHLDEYYTLVLDRCFVASNVSKEIMIAGLFKQQSQGTCCAIANLSLTERVMLYEMLFDTLIYPHFNIGSQMIYYLNDFPEITMSTIEVCLHTVAKYLAVIMCSHSFI